MSRIGVAGVVGVVVERVWLRWVGKGGGRLELEELKPERLDVDHCSSLNIKIVHVLCKHWRGVAMNHLRPPPLHRGRDAAPRDDDSSLPARSLCNPTCRRVSCVRQKNLLVFFHIL